MIVIVQVQLAVSRQRPEPRLAWLLALEFSRMAFEAVFEHYTSVLVDALVDCRVANFLV